MTDRGQGLQLRNGRNASFELCLFRVLYGRCLQALAQKFGIQGFPTIMLFGADKTNPTLYEGARTAGAIEAYAIAHMEMNVAAPEVVELVGQVGVHYPGKPLQIA